MRWDDYRQSDNVFNRRGEGGGSGAGFGGGGGFVAFMLLRMIFSRFGIGGVVVAVGGFLLLSMVGLNPLTAGGQGVQGAGGQPPSSAYDREIATILATTEDVWCEEFAERGASYPPPSLNLFAGGINAGGCGYASSAVGPFYCPANRQIYIDTGFFDQLDRRLGAPGDFARAYVIAHEVGHHIQTVTGVAQDVRERQARARGEAERNAYSVRLELMADYLAGVWARNAQDLDGFALEEGDLQEGLRAANAIGDDALSGGRARPDSFTHGTSEQRRRWLQLGYRSGEMEACDTLSAEVV